MKKIFLLYFLLFFSIVCTPNQIYAYSISCEESIKNELWPHIKMSTEVRKLQSFLTQLGYKTPNTGFYGNQTTQSLRQYQANNGIFPTGVLGSMTRLLINQDLCNTPVEKFDPQQYPVVKPMDGVLLSVPLVEQSYRLSCEAASMEMVLRYYNHVANQSELMKKIGYADPYIKKYSDNVLIWGDPDIGFVGDEKGYIWIPTLGLHGATGWGVNPGPVARVLKAFLPQTLIPTNPAISDIITALENQKPVIFWHKRDDMYEDTIVYMTPLGKSIDFTSNHVSVIVGYEKKNDGKRYFWINDPTYGRLHIDEETLVRWWKRQDYKLVIAG